MAPLDVDRCRAARNEASIGIDVGREQARRRRQEALLAGEELVEQLGRCAARR